MWLGDMPLYAPDPGRPCVHAPLRAASVYACLHVLACMPAQASTCAHFIEERLCCRFHSHMQCFATGRMPHASGSMPWGVEAPGGSCRQLSACWRRQLLKSSSHDGVVHLQQSMQLCRASEPSTRCAGQGTPCSPAWVAAEPGYTVKA